MDWKILLDIVVFVAFIVAVVATGILKSRHEKDSESYFLAGRGLVWYLIGFSLIAANISTEQFVGQSGQGASDVGLAVASYEWVASITLVAVAFLFLPAFLRAGVYTIPEFLEYRFNHSARTLMSLLMMLTFVCVNLPAVIYSGAKTGEVFFGGSALAGISVDLYTVSWILGILAAIYVAAGGLKACAWADLLQGSALIVGGAIVLVLALSALGQAPPESIGLPAEAATLSGVERFRQLGADKLHMLLPADNTILPWTALILGIWIPNFYYWGLNQYIVQRTLGSRSLGEGQKGVVLAAGLKLLIPFIVIVPGIIAFHLFRDDMRLDASEKNNQRVLETFAAHKDRPAGSKIVFPFDADFARLYPDTAQELTRFNAASLGAALPPEDAWSSGNADWLKQNLPARNRQLAASEQIAPQKLLIGYKYDSAFGLLLKKLVSPGLRGFVLAAILGAVTSTLAALLNAASTIFTMDLYKEYLNRGATQSNLVMVGRVSVVACVVAACLLAPLVDNPRFGGMFNFIQEFQGFLSPGVLGVFLFGLFIHRAPRECGVVGLLVSPAMYAALMLLAPELAFLHRMAIAFLCVMAVLAAMTLVRPLPAPVAMPTQDKMDLRTSRGAVLAGLLVVAVTLVLYAIFC